MQTRLILFDGGETEMHSGDWVLFEVGERIPGHLEFGLGPDRTSFYVRTFGAKKEVDLPAGGPVWKAMTNYNPNLPGEDWVLVNGVKITPYDLRDLGSY